MASLSICEAPGCGKPAKAKRLCWGHYQRQRIHGDLGGSKPVSTPGEHKAWIIAHVGHDGSGCLEWPFRRNSNGYGIASVGGKGMFASRAMAIAALGEPPSNDHEAAHTCGRGTDGCVHPKHIYWATPQQNQHDRLAHGTDTRGEKQVTSKLTQADVDDIRRALKTRVFGQQRKLAIRFGVAEATICDIKKGRKWAY